MECYLDCAATTKVYPETIAQIAEDLKNFYNPSALYENAQNNKNKIQIARQKIAKSIRAKESEIFFTSCGTESNNWVLKCFPYTPEKNHIITSTIEHHSVLRTCEQLKQANLVDVTYIQPNSYGVLSIEDIQNAIQPNTALISIMTINNVLGTIQPIKEIGDLCNKLNIAFHTDAVQAVGHIPINVKNLHIDFLSCSGHKIHAPKGCGFLYCNSKYTPYLKNLLCGGGQEFGHRAGTENIPYITALANCVESSCANIPSFIKETRIIQSYLLSRLTAEFSNIHLNGTYQKKYRVSSNINIAFADITADVLVMCLSEYGILASEGSACDTGNLDVNYVLQAIGVSNDYIEGGLRLTFDETLTIEQCDYFVESLKKILLTIRGYI